MGGLRDGFYGIHLKGWNPFERNAFVGDLERKRKEPLANSERTESMVIPEGTTYTIF